MTQSLVASGALHEKCKNNSTLFPAYTELLKVVFIAGSHPTHFISWLLYINRYCSSVRTAHVQLHVDSDVVCPRNYYPYTTMVSLSV